MLKWQELLIQKHFEDVFHFGSCIISRQNFVLLIEIRSFSPMLVSIQYSGTNSRSLSIGGVCIRLNLQLTCNLPFRWSIQSKNKFQSTWSLFGFDNPRWSCRSNNKTKLYKIEFCLKRICCFLYKVILKVTISDRFNLMAYWCNLWELELPT